MYAAATAAAVIAVWLLYNTLLLLQLLLCLNCTQGAAGV
jgi:hypothetical protein